MARCSWTQGERFRQSGQQWKMLSRRIWIQTHSSLNQISRQETSLRAMDSAAIDIAEFVFTR